MKRILLSIMSVITVVIFSTIITANGMNSDTSSSSPTAQPTGVNLQHEFVPEYLLKDGQKEITREEFCSVVVNLYEYVTNSKVVANDSANVFSDTSNTDVIKAFELGIVLGAGDTKFLPQNSITLQEKATMLYRALKKIYPNLNTDLEMDFSISDKDQISTWALDAIKYLCNDKVLFADDNNRINSLAKISRDKSNIITNRFYDLIKEIKDNDKTQIKMLGSNNLKVTADSSAQSNYALLLKNRAYMVANSNNVYNFAIGDFTLEAWIKPTTAGTIFGRKSAAGGYGNGGFLLVLRNDSTFKLATDNGVGFYEIDSVPTSSFDGKWHHIAGVRQNGNLQLYFDGNLLSTNIRSNASTPLYVNNGLRLLIGSVDQYQEQYINYTGLLDEVRIWNISRSQFDIRTYMFSKLNPEISGLVGYWNFDNKDGTDLSSLNNTLRTQGNVSYVEGSIS